MNKPKALTHFFCNESHGTTFNNMEVFKLKIIWHLDTNQQLVPAFRTFFGQPVNLIFQLNGLSQATL
jgi:hypothetical protein